MVNEEYGKHTSSHPKVYETIRKDSKMKIIIFKKCEITTTAGEGLETHPQCMRSAHAISGASLTIQPQGTAAKNM